MSLESSEANASNSEFKSLKTKQFVIVVVFLYSSAVINHASSLFKSLLKITSGLLTLMMKSLISAQFRVTLTQES